MKKLNGSIGNNLKLKGSAGINTILSGSIKSIKVLKGSVESFIRSLTTRANIITRVIVNCSAMVRKKVKNLTVKIRVELSARAMAFKIAKSNITIRSVVNVKAKVYKVIKPTIGLDIVIGKSSLLSQLKDLTLGEMKDKTLKELSFSLGVLANIVRRTGNIDILPQVEMSVNAKVIRYRTLGDLKNMTLGEMKDMTLRELIEYEV